MRVDNNILIYKTSDKPSKQPDKKEQYKCPFCGYTMKQVEGSNVKVCSNKKCKRSQSFYKLMK